MNPSLVMGATFLAPVRSKEALPKPEPGLMAFDEERSIEGRIYFWIVENGEWISTEVTAPITCPYCGK